MNKIFTASDFIYDLKKNVFKSKHSLQLFITEFDFLALSNELLELFLKVTPSSPPGEFPLQLAQRFKRLISTILFRARMEDDFGENL